MLDTVQIKHCYSKRLRDEQLEALGATFKYSGRYPIWALNPPNGKPQPRITFLFPDGGIMHVMAEVSLPRMLFGHNARLPTFEEVLTGMHLIGEFMQEKTELDFDSATAIVSLIHFAKDIQLGEPGANGAMKQLSQIKIKGLDKLFYNDTTLYFRNKSREFRIYPKLQEVLANGPTQPGAIAAARGNLRFEYCLLNKYGIDSHVKKIGLCDSTVKSLVSKEVSDFMFSRLFSEFRFPGLLTDEKSSLEMLKEKFSGRKAMTLFGFLANYDRYGALFYKDPEHGIKKGAYYRALNDCRKAGVWRAGE